jgi:LPS export ABC transporter protein LptC
MNRWHGPARLILAIFAIVFAVGVYFSIGRRPRPTGPAPQTQADREAVVVSQAGEVIMFKGSKQDVRIEHQKRITYQSGRTKFFTTKVTILDRGERNFEVTSDEAEVAENQSAIDMRGHVVITASDGLTVKTDNATYTQSDETMRAPGKVEFSRARMTGTSQGATYDKTRDVLWLLDQAHIVVTPDEKGQGGVDVNAGAAGYARRDRYMRFERGVRMVRGAQALDAANAMAYLRDAEDKLEVLELRGNSRVSGVGSGPSSLQAMTARDMNLDYAEDGQTLQKAILVGDGIVQLANATGGPGTKLSSQSIDIELAPDGNTLNSLGARDRVQLDLPAGPDTPARQIKSVTLEARAEPGKTGLSAARLVGQVVLRETRPAAGAQAAVDSLV